MGDRHQIRRSSSIATYICCLKQQAAEVYLNRIVKNIICYIATYIYRHICDYIYTYTHIYRLRLICRHIKIYTYTQLHIHRRTYTCTYTHIYLRTHNFFHVQTYIHRRVYICKLYIFLHMQAHVYYTLHMHVYLINLYRSVYKCTFVQIFIHPHIYMWIYSDQIYILYSAYIRYFSRWIDRWMDRQRERENREINEYFFDPICIKIKNRLPLHEVIHHLQRDITLFPACNMLLFTCPEIILSYAVKHQTSVSSSTFKQI